MAKTPNHPTAQLPNCPKVAFFGNTKYSVIDAATLHEKFGLVLIVTKPDKPSGRKRLLAPNPVKTFALENKIPFIETNSFFPVIPAKAGIQTKKWIPDQVGDDSSNRIDQMKKYSLDFIVVADFGVILPKEVLEIPKIAPINVHHSLLPKYRGPSPATAAILAGETESGVTIIRMNEKIDAGDILAQEKYRLKKEETTDSLLTKLNKVGAELACQVIENWKEIKPLKQDESQATFSQRMSKEDGYIELLSPPSPAVIDRMIRAYYPWPGVSAEIETSNQEPLTHKMRIKLLPPTILPSRGPAIPFLIQPEGKRVMSPNEFKNGYPVAFKQISTIFGNS